MLKNMFVSKNVKVNFQLAFLKSKSQLPGLTAQCQWKRAGKKIHIERKMMTFISLLFTL